LRKSILLALAIVLLSACSNPSNNPNAESQDSSSICASYSVLIETINSETETWVSIWKASGGDFPNGIMTLRPLPSDVVSWNIDDALTEQGIPFEPTSNDTDAVQQFLLSDFVDCLTEDASQYLTNYWIYYN